MILPWPLLPILCFMPEQSTLKLIIISFEIKFFEGIFRWNTLLLMISSLMCSLKAFPLHISYFCVPKSCCLSPPWFWGGMKEGEAKDLYPVVKLWIWFKKWAQRLLNGNISNGVIVHLKTNGIIWLSSTMSFCIWLSFMLRSTRHHYMLSSSTLFSDLQDYQASMVVLLMCFDDPAIFCNKLDIYWIC